MGAETSSHLSKYNIDTGARGYIANSFLLLWSTQWAKINSNFKPNLDKINVTFVSSTSPFLTPLQPLRSNSPLPPTFVPITQCCDENVELLEIPAADRNEILVIYPTHQISALSHRYDECRQVTMFTLTPAVDDFLSFIMNSSTNSVLKGFHTDAFLA